MRAKKIASYGLLTALCLILGYLESLVPPLLPIPGMKLGLSNVVVMTALYLLGPVDALLINGLRILISGILFGRGVGFFYALAGGILSGIVMILLKKTKKFGIIAVSITGGLFHNLGQLLVAYFLIGSSRIFYYLPFLWISGIAAGAFIGLLAGIVTKYLVGSRKEPKP